MKSKLKLCFITIVLALSQIMIFAQGNSAKTELPKGWHLLDKQKDGYYGISLDSAYEFVHEKNLKSKTVLVAVIDSGVDTLHEDLKNILWTNSNEIPGNDKDDDNNGYADDIHGWNFIGGKDGRNVKDDSQEEGRVYYANKGKFEAKDFNPALLKDEDRETYDMWLQAKKKIMGDGSENAVDLVILKRV
jgi:subtilisin family serine protease